MALGADAGEHAAAGARHAACCWSAAARCAAWSRRSRVTRAIAGLLYDVSPLDPIVFVGVSTAARRAGFVASLIPARRATRVDPIVALRVP